MRLLLSGSMCRTTSLRRMTSDIRNCFALWAASSLLWSYAENWSRAAEPAAAPVGKQSADRYRIENLVIPAGELKLAGSLYLPDASPSAPAVVFVHGAAHAVRRDGYRELASHFAHKGICAFIYDKRGCGESGGDWGSASLNDLAGDALACVQVLRRRPEINPHQIGLWGLSQGASIVPLAAAQD